MNCCNCMLFILDDSVFRFALLFYCLISRSSPNLFYLSHIHQKFLFSMSRESLLYSKWCELKHPLDHTYRSIPSKSIVFGYYKLLLCLHLLTLTFILVTFKVAVSVFGILGFKRIHHLCRGFMNTPFFMSFESV